MGDVFLLSNLSRPHRLIELSNTTQMASRTLAENSRCFNPALRTRSTALLNHESAEGIFDSSIAVKRSSHPHLRETARFKAYLTGSSFLGPISKPVLSLVNVSVRCRLFK